MLLRTFCVVLVLAAMGCSAEKPTAQYVLTYASPYPPAHPFSRADQRWMAFVEERSAGRLHIKPYWSGAVLSSDQSAIEIRHGVADIGLITPIYMRGGMHASRAQAGFYGGVQSMQDQIDVLKCLTRDFPVFNAEMSGLHVLALQAGNFPGILTREKPVRTLADLRGLRLRSQSESIDVLRRLGADPVDMPMGEVYSAMAKGVIDGVVAPPDALRGMHLGEVGSYFTELKFSRGSYPARAMSQRAWERLPPDLQQILREGQSVWESALIDEINGGTRLGYDFARQQGVEFIEVSAADQNRFDAAAAESAAARARQLNDYGIDGEAIIERARALIRERAEGRELDCAGAPPVESAS
ncbi:TRAP transporter substrate-binding protein DctP [Povalibacter sp.]|uniref:TRAP transporter substrate-binding protein DctP n=1 Tax=Povalibacter sp. TaxID=1962978 RepID=UPI002F40D659